MYVNKLRQDYTNIWMDEKLQIMCFQDMFLFIHCLIFERLRTLGFKQVSVFVRR